MKRKGVTGTRRPGRRIVRRNEDPFADYWGRKDGNEGIGHERVGHEARVGREARGAKLDGLKRSLVS